LKSSRATIRKRYLDAVDIFQHPNHHQREGNVAVTEPSLAARQLIQRIAGRERWGGEWWLSIVQWGFLEDSGEFVHLRRNCLPTIKVKKSKINRIEIGIYFHAKNKSIGEDLFLDTKSKIDFSSLNIQNIAD